MVPALPLAVQLSGDTAIGLARHRAMEPGADAVGALRLCALSFDEGKMLGACVWGPDVRLAGLRPASASGVRPGQKVEGTQPKD
jgi:hypothetical protein